jgi:hypothetical protein
MSTGSMMQKRDKAAPRRLQRYLEIIIDRLVSNSTCTQRHE